MPDQTTLDMQPGKRPEPGDSTTVSANDLYLLLGCVQTRRTEADAALCFSGQQRLQSRIKTEIEGLERLETWLRGVSRQRPLPELFELKEVGHA